MKKIQRKARIHNLMQLVTLNKQLKRLHKKGEENRNKKAKEKMMKILFLVNSNKKEEEIKRDLSR